MRHGRLATTALPVSVLPSGDLVDSYVEYANPVAASTNAQPTSSSPTIDSAYAGTTLSWGAYKIFYPASTDDTILQGDANPWRTTWCPMPTNVGVRSLAIDV